MKVSMILILILRIRCHQVIKHFSQSLGKANSVTHQTTQKGVSNATMCLNGCLATMIM